MCMTGAAAGSLTSLSPLAATVALTTVHDGIPGTIRCMQSHFLCFAVVPIFDMNNKPSDSFVFIRIDRQTRRPCK